MIRYFFVVLAILFNILNTLYSQQTNTKSEYTFKYEKENYYNMSEMDSDNEISILIERRGLPLVNRLVRFTTLNPNMFTFDYGNENKMQKGELSLREIEENESNDLEPMGEDSVIIEENIINDNVYVVPTDENGIARAKLNLKEEGNGIVLMHILYVGSTGNTNISYEEYAYINIEDSRNSISSKIITGDIENINVTSSMFMTLTLFPALFLASIALLLISYFRNIYYEYRYAKSKIIMYTFFGFSYITKHFHIMLIIVGAELVIVGCFIFLNSYIFSVLLMTFFIAGFMVKREKIYAISFFILACISMIYLYLETFSNYLEIESLLSHSFMSNPIFVFFLFLLITSLSGGIYIPISIFVLYKTTFDVGDLAVVMGLIGIFVSSTLYVVKFKKGIPFFYSINLLKIKD